MKKRLIVLFMCLVVSLCASAQDYLTTGYRGFAEIGGRAVLTEDGFTSYSIGTSHGYQASKYLYVGGGLSIQPFLYSDDYTDFSFAETAFFLETKVDLGRKISPFCGLRVGGIGGEFSGFYDSAEIGVRFHRVSVSFGFETEKFSSFTIENTKFKDDKSLTLSNFLFTVAVDWGARNN